MLNEVRTIKEKPGDTEIWERIIQADIDKVENFEHPNPPELLAFVEAEPLLYPKEPALPRQKDF